MRIKEEKGSFSEAERESGHDLQLGTYQRWLRMLSIEWFEIRWR